MDDKNLKDKINSYDPSKFIEETFSEEGDFSFPTIDPEEESNGVATDELFSFSAPEIRQTKNSPLSADSFDGPSNQGENEDTLDGIDGYFDDLFDDEDNNTHNESEVENLSLDSYELYEDEDNDSLNNLDDFSSLLSGPGEEPAGKFDDYEDYDPKKTGFFNSIKELFQKGDSSKEPLEEYTEDEHKRKFPLKKILIGLVALVVCFMILPRLLGGGDNKPNGFVLELPDNGSVAVGQVEYNDGGVSVEIVNTGDIIADVNVVVDAYESSGFGPFQSKGEHVAKCSTSSYVSIGIEESYVTNVYCDETISEDMIFEARLVD